MHSKVITPHQADNSHAGNLQIRKNFLYVNISCYTVMILITLYSDEELDALIAQKAEAGERLTNFELKAGFLHQEGRTY